MTCIQRPRTAEHDTLTLENLMPTPIHVASLVA